MARQKTNLRLPPDLIESGQNWARDAGITFTRLVEDSLRERLGWAPESLEYRVGRLNDRVAELERAAKREGAVR